ncbi:MAG: acyltransferase [Desulfobulbaceae bacterium]|nr:acyltransferase [Desulfobulbaceae bacterium]
MTLVEARVTSAASAKVHIKEADGIRGLACLLVLVVHTTVITFPATYPYLRGAGKIGVWLFFTLSAFLLTYQLLLRGFSLRTLVDYGIGRTLRIYPLFVLAVLGYYFSLSSVGIATGADIIKAITFQQGYAHLWTIPVEFKFYFILPGLVLIGKLIHSQLGPKGLLAIGVILTISHQFYAPYWLLPESTIDTVQYLPAFLFGIIGALIKVHHPDSWLTERGALIGSVILIMILASTPVVRYFVLGLPPSDYLMNKYLFFSLAWALFIFSQTHSRGFLSRLWSSRPFVVLGLASYSIYLIHWLILHKISAYYPERYATGALVILLSIASGYAMHRFFEKPLFAVRKGLLGAFDRLRLAGSPATERTEQVGQCDRVNRF